jgi:hypothetical protein
MGERQLLAGRRREEVAVNDRRDWQVELLVRQGRGVGVFVEVTPVKLPTDMVKTRP